MSLPLTVAFAQTGNEVVCFDVEDSKIEASRESRSYVEDIADATLAPLADRLRPISRHTDLAGCEAIVDCAPTPLTSALEPDLTYLLDAARQIAQILQPGQLIVLESTTYPGTTRDELEPILAAPRCG